MSGCLGQVESFDELRERLKALVPDQCIGEPSTVCETGDRYQSILVKVWSRPEDLEALTKVAANEMADKLSEALSGKNGKLYWRIPLETANSPGHTVIKWDDDGPDIDFALDKRGYFDKNWIIIKAYARFFRAAS